MAVQLAGCEPQVMAEAAKLNADRGARIIDINFGCPVKKVVNGHAGSALMRDESAGRAHPRSDGRGGRSAGHLEDAHRLGRAQSQRAAARPDCRSMRHPHDHGARPHPLPALCRRRLIGGSSATVKESGHDPGHRRTATSPASTMPIRLCRIGRRRLDDRPRLLWTAMVHSRRLSTGCGSRRRTPDPPLSGAARDRAGPLRRHADPLRERGRLAHRRASIIGWYSKGFRGRRSSAPRSTRRSRSPRVRDADPRLLRAADGSPSGVTMLIRRRRRKRARAEPDAPSTVSTRRLMPGGACRSGDRARSRRHDPLRQPCGRAVFRVQRRRS